MLQRVMKILKLFCGCLSLATVVDGWAFGARRLNPKALYRKAFLTGGTAGALVGAAATAGAAVAINERLNSRQDVYEPKPGSMDGQVVLITGGSSGLGLESAKRLGAAGATIVVTSRNTSKGETAVREVKKYVATKGVEDTSKVYNLILDLDDLESIKSFPSSFKQLGLGTIDVLLNNAGVMAIPNLQLTKDGYERTFQSNHLGHFALTAGLFPYLNREKATVVNVSSAAYAIAAVKGLEIDNLNGEHNYGAWTSYGQSKLANILFTRELQKRADAVGDSWLTTVTLHPGAVRTDLGRYIVGEEKWDELKSDGPSGLESFAMNAMSLFTKTPEEGASTHIFLASGGEGSLEKGSYYADMKAQSLPPFAKDEYKAKVLWEKSEEFTGVKFDLSSEGTKDSAIAETS